MIIGVILVTISILGLLFLFVVTTDRRRFQRTYKVKLPLLSWVTLTSEPDKIVRGHTRNRFITSKGKKDLRHSLNFKVVYPTVIVLNKYKVKIWRKQKANKLYDDIQHYMDIPLSNFAFPGDVVGHYMDFFKHSQRRFVLYCATLFNFIGYRTTLTKKKTVPIIIVRANGDMYAFHVALVKRKIVLNDMIQFDNAQKGGIRVFITSTSFTTGARGYAISHGIYMMDLDCLRRSKLYEDLKFL